MTVSNELEKMYEKWSRYISKHIIPAFTWGD